MESEDLQLSSPELHTARVRVLDYFGAQVHCTPSARPVHTHRRTPSTRTPHAHGTPTARPPPARRTPAAHALRAHTARRGRFGARQAVPESRRIFRFERSMEFGGAEALLLRQLCLHMAFPTEPAATLLPAYLSGESRLMLENFPELGFFRDIVFLFKMLMVPP